MSALLKKNTARAILIVFALVGVAWLAYVAAHHKEKLSLEVLDLIPAGERAPELVAVRDLANEKQARVALFALRIIDDNQRERAASAFTAALLASNAFVEAEISGDTTSRNALGKQIFDQRLALLAPGWLARQHAAFKPDGAAFSPWLADRAAAGLEQFMSQPEALAFGEIVGADPLLLLPSLVDKVQGLDQSQQNTPVDITLIWALTRDKPLDSAKHKLVFNAVDAALAAAHAIAPDATLRWTAVSRFAAENERHIIWETIVGTILSLFVVLGIAVICLPSLPKALMLMPVVLGALLGACVAVTLCFERVHFLVFILGLMLVGVSIDYGFYLYLQPRARPDENYEGKVRRLLKPLLGSALTTVLGFTLLLFSDLPLIRQLGVFVSAGLLCALAVAVLWFAQIKNPWLQARPFANAQVRATPRSRRVALVILALGAIVALTGPWRLHWHDDVQSLQISAKQLMREAAEVRALFGDTRERTVYITRGEDIVAARDNLGKFLAWHASRFPNAATATLGEAVPLRADYDAMPARLGELRDFASDLRVALERHGFEAGEFAPFFAAWNAFVAQTAKSAEGRANPPGEPTKGTAQPEASPYHETIARLAASLRGQTALLMSTTPGASWFVTVAAHPAGEEPPAELATVSLNQIESLNKIFTRYRLSALRLSIIGLALVGLSMWLIYGVKRGSLIFATPVGSCLFAFGVFGLLGVTLNLFHLLGAFLGVCLSHNYAIFNAENEIRREQPPPSIRLSALCTAASFGVLACSGIPVVSALGVTVALIVLTALAVVELRRVAKAGK